MIAYLTGKLCVCLWPLESSELQTNQGSTVMGPPLPFRFDLRIVSEIGKHEKQGRLH
jgi:hypothetical protein